MGSNPLAPTISLSQHNRDRVDSVLRYVLRTTQGNPTVLDENGRLLMSDDGNEICIVAFGDSITEASHQEAAARWPVILGRALQERFPEVAIKMINAGVGGNTSREGLKRIEQDVLRHNPRFVLVEFGNDATFEPERQVALEEFSANLGMIRAKVEQRSKGRLLLLTFPPIIDHWHCYYQHEFYKQNGGQDACQERYRETTRHFAQVGGVPLVDLDKAMRQAISKHGAEEYIMSDGVHLTAQGNRFVASLVFELLSMEIATIMAKGGS